MSQSLHFAFCNLEKYIRQEHLKVLPCLKNHKTEISCTEISLTQNLMFCIKACSKIKEGQKDFVQILSI